ncbi:Gfo/Idh/MocA family oxidoreductase [Xanthocytophaga agilis]|uniref:Gfo/Idh/MocA family oxidoreductase n=1 Tax=Xanthocytophaga agilis TaxID=3048010 RepID=A0AAE3R9A5_9BACT|nr:Gfo/Idh/MocA family oxidoreductase [Xanthocytophaga agilis]MDJ1503107.1 Gfo/Idh/MocA family oxidoreductase [Xanthocytophaga agilis]
MKTQSQHVSRRSFLAATGATLTGSLLVNPFSLQAIPITKPAKKVRLAMVGTGSRGSSMWGTDVQKNYSEHIEFVGLCDINPGRLEYVKKRMGVTCPTYTDFDKMMKEAKPDTLIVTTVDATHHEFIIKGLEMGANVLTEKPMTTDETKCQAILDAEKRSGKKVTVTFNYRYSPHRAKMYELLRQGAIGKLTSVDFHWYLDTSHGADYFRRWHRLVEKSGSLWVHKASHHFDLLNWWIDSDPTEVYASASLDHYGKNNSFRHTNCRPCPHKDKCKYYWDITKNESYVNLYVNNEKHDGYLRDGCVWKEDINIYDKMAATIKYANGVQVSYSLTTYSPYEGYRIAFNGTEGRLEAWIQESNPTEKRDYDELMLTKNFGEREYIKVSHGTSGHGGGDKLLKDRIFIPGTSDPLRQSAGTRDGALAILIGIAARKSTQTGQIVKIGDLTTIKPQAQKA